MKIFHGGCINCKTQDEMGIGFCKGCMYCKPDWNLPNLSVSDNWYSYIPAQKQISFLQAGILTSDNWRIIK